MDEASIIDSTNRAWVMAPGSKIVDSSEAAFALRQLPREEAEDAAPAPEDDDEEEDLGL